MQKKKKKAGHITALLALEPGASLLISSCK